MAQAPKKHIRDLVKIMRKEGHIVNEGPYELNIVGVRNKGVRPTHFDDTMYVFWKNPVKKWDSRAYRITTDPSVHYLKNPIGQFAGQDATAILKGGQYKNAYSIGLHRGIYPALIQNKGRVTVYRDWDRNARILLDDDATETGFYGINIHRASLKGTTEEIDLWSAGCQVFANIDNFNEFMELAEKHKGLHGNLFTYTLIDEWAREQHANRRIFIGGTVLVTTLVAGYFGFKKFIE